MIEIWKSVNNFSKYEVSNTGFIRSIKSKKLLTNNPKKTGYILLNIYTKSE